MPCPAGDSPLACNIGAMNATERHQYNALTEKVLAAVEGRTALPDGYALRIDRQRVSIAEIAKWIEFEQRCCPFFDFQLRLDRENGPVTLTLTGRKGVKEFLDAELKR